jgi:hypothetical protein
MDSDLRLFDAFQFGEPHEAPLMLAKLTIEAPLVERWIVVENTFTHKGERKPAYLADVVADSAFDEFRDRLDIVSLDHDFARDFRRRPIDRAKFAAKLVSPGHDNIRARVVYDERPRFFAERQQRDSALEPLFDASGGDGWVVVTDVDEFLDCSRSGRRDALVRSLRGGANVHRLRRQRFTFDIDNFCPAVRFVGCASIAYLRKEGVGLQAIRIGRDGRVPSLEPLVYEYSFCLERSAIDRKIATVAHSYPGASALQRALECNHGFFWTAPNRIDGEQWYERVDIERIGAPQYVMEHAASLRTGNFNADYEEARKRRYPQLFGWK